MIAALALGRAGSKGCPNKNVMKLLGRPLMAYPIIAAKNSLFVDKIYLSTDSEEMKKIGKKYGAGIIDRPKELATDAALAEDAFRHGFEEIKKRNPKQEIELMVWLFCNSPTITPGIIDRGIKVLRQYPDLDSAVTVSKYNMWSPLRARKIEDNLVKPYISPSHFKGATCDRNSTDDVWYHDCSAFVLRPHCLEPGYGQPPHPWVGRKVYPLKQWGGIDIDYDWGFALAEFWLKKHGFSKRATPYNHFQKE